MPIEHTTVEEATAALAGVVPDQRPSASSTGHVKRPVAMFMDRKLQEALPSNKYDQVYSGIYLGDQWLAQHKSDLQRLGITHIVNTAQGSKFCQINTDQDYYSDIGCTFYGIQAQDTMGFKMSVHFKSASEFIDGALQNKGKIYVHCFQGMSRSATVVLAFLMLHRDMSLLDAIKHVRKRRAIHPNAGFMRQLVELNNQLAEAQQANSSSTQQAVTSTHELAETSSSSTQQAVTSTHQPTETSSSTQQAVTSTHQPTETGTNREQLQTEDEISTDATSNETSPDNSQHSLSSGPAPTT